MKVTGRDVPPTTAVQVHAEQLLSWDPWHDGHRFEREDSINDASQSERAWVCVLWLGRRGARWLI